MHLLNNKIVQVTGILKLLLQELTY